MKTKATPKSPAQVPPATGTPPKSLPAALGPIDQTLVWIVEGHSEHDIAQAIATKWPAEAPAALITKAMQKLAASAEPDTDALKGWVLEAKRHLYRKALEIGDFAGALSSVKAIEATLRKGR